MTYNVQQMMVTTIAILLLLVTVATGVTGDGIHQAQETQGIHHRHQNRITLHQDRNYQRFGEPQSGIKTSQFLHSELLLVNSKSSREETNDHSNDDKEGLLHPDKKWDNNSTAKYENNVLTNLTKKEPSLDPGKFSPVDHQSPGEAQYVPRRVEIISPGHRRPKLARTISFNLENRDNVTKIRRKAQAAPALNNHVHQTSPPALQGTKRAYTSDLEGAACTSDADCYLQNFNATINNKGAVVHEPFCQALDNSSSEGYCTCGEYCVSRSKNSADEHFFYYCGSCGRMGSSCSSSMSCNHTLSTCLDGYCSCDSGEFYDLYYCMIPYYGYEKALQVAIATCIFVAVCLLAATIYSSLYRRQQGRVHPYLLRLLMRRANQGTRESPPGDTPPKYDDVVEQPPSYQQALELERSTDEQVGGTEEQEGKDNLAFDGDNTDTIPSRETSHNIRKDSRAPDEGINISVVATTSSSNNINSNSDGDTNSNNSNSEEADDSVSDEYARHVARHTGAIPKQRSLAKIKQKKMKRVTQQHQKTAPGVVEEGCLSGEAVSSRSGDDMAVSGDGRDSCSVDDVDDMGLNSIVRDTCSVDSKGKGVPSTEQPITLPLRQQRTSSRSTQF